MAKKTSKNSEIKSSEIVDESLDKKESQDINSNKIEELEKEISEEHDRYLRLLAEFDNYKKRTLKEKQDLYSDSKIDVISKILPLIDNLNRALDSNASLDSLRKGVELIIKQSDDLLESLGVEEIPAVGCEFDPKYHNAVAHIDDNSYNAQEICEVYQKGYKLKEKVIRYASVKVAN